MPDITDRAQSAVLRGRLSWPLLYLMAPVLGALVAAGSLAYDPLGRINVLPLLLVWGLMPALGSLFALVWAARGGQVPWPVRRDQRLHLPPGVIWSTGARLQWAWAAFAAGLLLSFLAHLAFTDLAFGWSSTLVAGNEALASVVQAVSVPWAGVWPAAVPGQALIDVTRYERIAPAATVASGASWWPFLAAVVLGYSLLPRVILGVVFTLLARRSQARGEGGLRLQSVGRAAVTSVASAAPSRSLCRETMNHWSSAVRLYWQQTAPDDDASALSLGLGDWASDARRLSERLAVLPSGQPVLWWVPLMQTPVAELADLMGMTRDAGCRQGLFVSDAASETDERFVLSWQAFAERHELIWVDAAGEGES